MVDIFLIIAFCLYVVLSGCVIIKRNMLFGGLYFFLFIYSIFAQIGYCFFPELSELAKAYFGKRAFYTFYAFNFLSFLLFFIVFLITYPFVRRIKQYPIIKTRSEIIKALFQVIIFSYFSFLAIYLFTHLSIISWINNNDVDFANSQGIVYKTFATSFKFLAGTSIIFYTQWRVKDIYPDISRFSKPFVTMMLLISISLLFLICNQLGSRTDIVAFALGVIFFEIKMGINVKKILIFVSAILIVVPFLLYIEKSRATGPDITEGFSLYEIIIFKDYFAPAHMLYTVIGYDYVRPFFVIYSNLSNSLFGLNVDYLQMPITELISPGLATRSTGYAFYLFTEGYMFMGFFGFIYNALMLMTGLTVWYIIYNSRNKYYNYIIIALMSTQLANLSRGQSSYFYKELWTFFLTFIMLIYLSSGLRIKFFSKR